LLRVQRAIRTASTVIISFGGVILGKRAGVRMGKHAEVMAAFS
jgi:hypothetical protein